MRARDLGRAFLVGIVILLTLAGGCAGAPALDDRGAPAGATAPAGPVTPAGDGDALLAIAFAEHAAGLQVEAAGIVARILADDAAGARHQRFIVRLSSGQTVLIAHNIDLAPRVEGLRVGDAVSFGGQYEWSPAGGTVHWTHRDPAGEHVAGWVCHRGRTYH